MFKVQMMDICLARPAWRDLQFTKKCETLAEAEEVVAGLDQDGYPDWRGHRVIDLATNKVVKGGRR